MKIKRILILLATVLLLGVMVGCAQEQQEPKATIASPESMDAISEGSDSESVVDNRTWAERTVQAYAEYSGISWDEYPENMLVLLEKNPETLGFVLRYPQEHQLTHEIDMSEYEDSEGVPLFIQWDRRWGYIPYGSDVAAVTGCGPLSLSMVAYYLTGDENMSPDKILQFAIDNGYCTNGNGSTWTLISAGAKKLGLNVKEIANVEGRIKAELEAGHPVICVMGPGVFTTTGHYIVLTGYEDGKFRVNDPNSVVKSSKLWSYDEIQDQFRNIWAISLPESEEVEMF